MDERVEAHTSRARAGHGGLNGTPDQGSRPSLESGVEAVDQQGNSGMGGTAAAAVETSTESAPTAIVPTATAAGTTAASFDDDAPPVYDLSYRDAFWRTRDYEDRCDRLALRALLPWTGRDLLDLGAGFGRLADEYHAFWRVTLLDASETLLEAARERLAGDTRFTIVQGEATHLPFADDSFDTVVSVRVLVNIEDPLPVFQEVNRVLRPGGVFVFEFPNRAHVLAAARYVLGRQDWSPSSLEPHEYRPAHFSHHTSRIKRQLREAGLEPQSMRAVSLFRSGWLKQHVPAMILAGVEARLQGPLGPLAPSPSVYIRAMKPNVATIEPDTFGQSPREIGED